MDLRLGIDAVMLKRWERAGDVGEAVLTPEERIGPTWLQAARFAVKEATLKCLDSSVLLYDLQTIRVRPQGQVEFEGAAARKADELGLDQWRSSYTRTSDAVIAVVAAFRGTGK